MFKTLQYSNLDNIIFEGPPKAPFPKKSRRGQPSADMLPTGKPAQAGEREITPQGQTSDCSNTEGDGLAVRGQACLQDLFDFSDDNDVPLVNTVVSQQKHNEGSFGCDTSIDPVFDQVSRGTSLASLPSHDLAGRDGKHGDILPREEVGSGMEIQESLELLDHEPVTENAREEPTELHHPSEVENEDRDRCIDVDMALPLTQEQRCSDHLDRYDIRDNDSLFDCISENCRENDVDMAVDRDCLNGDPRREISGATTSLVRETPLLTSPSLDRTRISERRRVPHNHRNGQGTDKDKQDQDDYGTISDPNDEDYADESTVDSKNEEQQYLRKLRRQGGNERKFGNTSATAEKIPFDLGAGSGRGEQAVSFCVTKDTDAIYIHGFLPPKALKSKIVFSLTASHNPVSQSFTIARRDIPSDCSSSSHAVETLPPPRKDTLPQIRRNCPFSLEEDTLLMKLKREDQTWDNIAARFPGRSKGSLQVHYSTKLKRQRKGQQWGRKRQRSSS